MILEHVVNCINEVYEDVVNSPSVDIQKWVYKLQEMMDQDDTQMIMKKAIMNAMTLCLSQGIIDDDFFESTLLHNFEFIAKKVPEMKKSMLLKIELEGLEKQIYRTMKVPYGIILADLAYLILASMNAEGSHLFSLSINGQNQYGCDACDEEFIDDYAADVTIPELHIEKGDQIELWYDFGDNYYFQIEVLDIEEHEDIQLFDNLEIIKGQGYGIWEDEHQFLDMYYHDREEFIRTIEDYGLSEDDFIFEDFDLDASNEMIIEDFEFLKMAYETPEEIDM